MGDKPETTLNADDLIEKIRKALSLHYDYPADSMDADRACPVTDAAFVALDLLHLEVKHTQEAIEDLREHHAKA